MAVLEIEPETSDPNVSQPLSLITPRCAIFNSIGKLPEPYLLGPQLNEQAPLQHC